MYKREIDLNALPIDQGKGDGYCPENLKWENLERHDYSNEEIVDSVTEQMRGTLDDILRKTSSRVRSPIWI
jgi:hypothetical protein